MIDAKGDVSRLLEAWSQGKAEALDELIPLVYDELRQIARRHLAFPRRLGMLNRMLNRTLNP